MKKAKDEPFFHGDQFTGTISEALTWYRRNTTPTQQKQWVIGFLEQHNRLTRLPFTSEKPFPPEVLDRARACDEGGCIGIGSVARLLMKGVKLDATIIDRFNANIRTLKAKPPRAPRRMTIAGLDKIRQQIDETVDMICVVKRPKLPQVSKERWRDTLTTAQKDALIGKYTHLYEEVFAAAAEEDDELMEAYGNLNVLQLDAMVSYLESVVVYRKAK